MTSIESKITKSVSYQLLNLFVSGLAGIFFIPFIISGLGKEQYGLFEIVFSLNIINSVLDIGIGSTITNYTKRYFDLEGGKFSEFFWTFFWFKIFLSIIGFIICVLVAFNVETIFHKVTVDNLHILKKAILWFGVGVLIQNLNSFIDAVVNGFVRFDMTSFASICSKIFYVTAFFVWFYLGNLSIVEFSILTFVFVPFIKLLTQLIQVMFYIPEIISIPKKPKIYYIKETFNYLGGISFVTVSAQIFNHGTQTILSVIASPTVVGEFGIMQRILRLVKQISDMLIRPILPAAHELKRKYSIKKIIEKGTNIHSIIVTGLVFIILVNGEVLSQYYLQSEYQNFALHLTILGVQLILPSFAIMLMLYYNEGNSKMSVQFNLANTTLSILLAFLGIKYFGFIGFISGLTLGYSFCTIIQLFRYLKYYNVSNKDFFKIYLSRYITVGLGLIIFFIIRNLFGITLKGIVLWNLLIVIIFGMYGWIGISKGMKHSILESFNRN